MKVEKIMMINAYPHQLACPNIKIVSLKSVRMHQRTYGFILFLFLSISPNALRAQLGFCTGNSGDPIFTEDFGAGTTDGPALAPGTTFYNFTTGTPFDGSYTVSSTSNYFNWLSIQDRTPGDTNGKMFIVNASFTAGEFYQREVGGLCENTSYEFSSWLVNLQSPMECEGNSIPINVRFQIWDETDTILLAQGDTGNILARADADWEQYALVFKTEPGQTSVILKMRNNSNGGCGNDLAIDDILFKSCGDMVSVTDTEDETEQTVCADQGAVTTTLTANPDFSIYTTHAYQWQQSTDEENWVDILGEVNATLTTPPVAQTTYFRAKIAEDVLNVANDLCNVVSDVFAIQVLPVPNAPLSMGDLTICQGDTGTLSTTVEAGYVVRWYDAPVAGNLLLENSTTLATDTPGTYYAEANVMEIACASPTRTPVTLTVTQPPQVTDEDLLFCENTTQTLSAGLDNLSYQWSTGQTTRDITIDQAGTYQVQVTDANGCTAIKTIVLEELAQPEIARILSDGSSIVVHTANRGDFEYSLNGTTYQNSSVFETVEGGRYRIYVRNTANCDAVVQEFYHLVIPKFFTPNGDAVNDIFQPDGLEIFNTIRFSIFDRYGALLKTSSEQTPFWNGTFQGRDMPATDYWYHITADTLQFKGHFSLKR